MLGKIIASSTAVSLGVLWLLLIGTTPSTIGPMGLLIVFVLLYMSALGLLTFLIYATNMAIVRLLGVMTRRSGREHISLQKSYYYGSVAALAPVMLVAMQSVNEVGYYQFMLVVIFVIIGCIYIAKRTA